MGASCAGSSETPEALNTKNLTNVATGDMKPMNGSNSHVDLPEAIDLLEAAAGRMPKGDTMLKMQSACKLMRSIMRDDQPNPPAADQLAVLHNLPEALISSAPPALKASRPVGPELDVAVQLPPPLADDLARRVREWDFNLHEIDARELPELCFGTLLNHAEFHQLDINKTRLWRFVQEIASRYRSNPFHSFRHAVDVTICCGCLVRMIQATYKEVLADPQVVVALLVGAMFHDTDHPGVMNGFLIATRHPLALLYNNQSVLENHHCSTALSLLERPELNFLVNLPDVNQQEIKRHMIACVLATDVTTHMKFLKEFKTRLETDGAPNLKPDLVMQLVIKSADISNPTRLLKVYQPWIDGVMAEFFGQGDVERALGLPISMNCDRQTVAVAKCQVGFISFLVKPLFDGFGEYLPALKEKALANLEANLAHFKAQ